MKKVFLLPAEEDWIVDRFVKEWQIDNFDITTQNPLDAEVVWLFASWRWKHLPFDFLRRKKVITTVHHIVPEKFIESSRRDFLARDEITTVYHVYNENTKAFIEKLTKKPIEVITYWANQNIWKKSFTKEDLRKKYSLSCEDFLVGSFQRDTEGSDLITPKLEKGPDLLADYLELIKVDRKNLRVVLAGWRRQYIIKRLEQADIPYVYFERPSQEIVNELYQMLDLYPITARCEGGPQAIIECGLLNIPVVSRDIGIARQVLPATAISNKIDLAIPCVPNVEDWKLPKGYNQYRKLIERL
jgi:glycosyltransferase involved in cell wall biosynthesis